TASSAGPACRARAPKDKRWRRRAPRPCPSTSARARPASPERARRRASQRAPRALAAAQAHIEGTGATMGAAGLLEAEHDETQIGQRQPLRHQTPQHAPLTAEKVGGMRLGTALAGDDDDELAAARLLAQQESPQGRMCLALAQAV